MERELIDHECIGNQPLFRPEGDGQQHGEREEIDHQIKVNTQTMKYDQLTSGKHGALNETGRPSAVRNQALGRRKRKVDVYEQARMFQRRREPVDISANLEEQVEQKELKVVETQTEEFLRRPESPPYVPAKMGVDQSTQIEDSDGLFDFDNEVEPILDVIVSKTLEQAVIEVMREDDMKALQLRREELEAEKRLRRQQERDLELQEMSQLQVKEKLIQQERKRLEAEIVLCEKAAALFYFKTNIGSTLRHLSFRHLTEIGHFRDPHKDAVTNEFMPWLLDRVATRTRDLAVARRLTDAIIEETLRKQKQTQSANNKLRKRKGKTIRIYLRGKQILGTETAGPIELSVADTVVEAELKIRNWLAANLANPVSPPHGGFLQLALGQAVQRNNDDGAAMTLSVLNLVDSKIIDFAASSL